LDGRQVALTGVLDEDSDDRLQVLWSHGLQERRPEARNLSGVRIAGREARVARHKPAPGVPDRL
jgi:hypothetical protein